MKLLLLLAIGINLSCANEVTRANNEFAIDLYKELSKLCTGDFVACPTSAEVLFALMIADQDGPAANKLSRILHLPENKDERQKMFNTFFPFILSSSNIKLANKIFVEDKHSLTAEFRRIAENVFHVDITQMDFADAEQAAFNINEWIGRQTNDNIKDVINADDLDENSKVFLNALHFTGKWINPFNENETKNQTFHLNKTHQIEVTMMNQLSTLQFYSDSRLQTKFLELPYYGGNIAMTIVLPYHAESFSELEERIDDFIHLDLPYGEVSVKASIPKFITETEIDFKRIIDYIAAEEDVVNSIPGLSSIKIPQKTVVQFSEKGSFVDSVTAVGIHPQAETYDVRNTNLFIANHPFIYYIKAGKLVLYVGKYTGVTGHCQAKMYV